MLFRPPPITRAALALPLLFHLLSAESIAAQDVFGTLRGSVSDRSGNAVSDASVQLVGTVFAATSNATGRYEIALVPAGAYGVRLRGDTSAALESPNVWVRAGATTIVNFIVGADSTVMEPVMSGVAPTSGSVIRGGDLARLSVDDPRQALASIPGVIMRGGEIGVAPNVGLTIRGGGAAAASVYVDGAPVRFQTLGVTSLTPGVNAIDEVAVTTGVSAASVADANGGVIGYVTRIGGPSLRGSLHAESDGPLGDALGVGYNRFAGDAGGPFPGIRNLSWFASATLQGQQSAYRGVGAADQPTYAIGGLDTVVQRTFNGSPISDTLWSFVPASGLRRPMDWTTHRVLHGRILYTFGSGSSISVTGLSSDIEQRSYPGTNLLDPALYGGGRAWSRLGVVNWGQPLGRFRGGPLTLEANLSLASDNELAGTLAPSSEATTRDPAFGIELGSLEFFGNTSPFPVDDTYIRYLRNVAGTLVPYLGRNDLIAFQASRKNTYGIGTGWPTQGSLVSGVAQILSVAEQRLSTRWQLHWRASPVHEVTFGLDMDRTDITAYRANLFSLLGLDAFIEHPRRVGVFAGDRLDFGKVVLDLGMRYDRFAPGGEFPKVPGRIVTSGAWTEDTVATDTAYTNSLSRVMDPGRTQGLLSPRIRLGYSPRRSTSLRLAYGQQIEPPAYAALFGGNNSDLAFNSSSFAFGRDIDFGKSWLVEAGVRQRVVEGLALDVSAFDKRLVRYGLQFSSYFDPYTQTNQNFLVLAQTHGQRSYGLDARLDLAAGDAVSGSLTYSLVTIHSQVNGPLGPLTSSATTHAIYTTLDFRAPERWRSGVLGSALRDLDALVTVRATSGLPYTRLSNLGTGVVTPGLNNFPIEELNSSRLPWTKVLDLRVSRLVRVGGQNWTVFVDARNLLNFRNVLALFAETSANTNPVFQASVTAAEPLVLRSEAQANGALMPDGITINLQGSCATWQNPTDCVALRRVEARFGNGDGVYTATEQQNALNAWYLALYGPSRFYGPGRMIRLGVSLSH